MTLTFEQVSTIVRTSLSQPVCQMSTSEVITCLQTQWIDCSTCTTKVIGISSEGISTEIAFMKTEQDCSTSRQLGCQHDTSRVCCWVPCCGAVAAVRRCPPLSIDVSCPHGTQQQTLCTPLLRSNDGTDRRMDVTQTLFRILRGQCWQLTFASSAVELIEQPRSERAHGVGSLLAALSEHDVWHTLHRSRRSAHHKWLRVLVVVVVVMVVVMVKKMKVK